MSSNTALKNYLPSLPSILQSNYELLASFNTTRSPQMSSIPARTAITMFTRNTRGRVALRCNTRFCWNCEAGGAEYYHVVAPTDSSFPVMQETGMMTFEELVDYQNCVLLCAYCHFHFDRTSNTSFIFLPTDLQYFVDYEERDFIRRLTVFEETGEKRCRDFPNEIDYELHARKSGELTEPDDGLYRGGLYNRYILCEKFSPQMLRRLVPPGTTTVFPFVFPGGPKRWHGAPMAAINQGCIVLGSKQQRLPEHVSQLLRRLQRLYSRTLDEEILRKAIFLSTLFHGRLDNVAGQDSENTDYTLAQVRALLAPEQQTRSTQSGIPKTIGATSFAESIDSTDSSDSTDSWYFGPSSSSTDKILEIIGNLQDMIDDGTLVLDWEGFQDLVNDGILTLS